MIILRKYPEEEQKEFSGRRNLAAKVNKYISLIMNLNL